MYTTVAATYTSRSAPLHAEGVYNHIVKPTGAVESPDAYGQLSPEHQTAAITTDHLYNRRATDAPHEPDATAAGCPPLVDDAKKKTKKKK